MSKQSYELICSETCNDVGLVTPTDFLNLSNLITLKGEDETAFEDQTLLGENWFNFNGIYQT